MPLTERQLEILRLVSLGEDYDSVGAKLSQPASEAVVKNLACKMFREMGVSNKTEAACTALRRGWIE
jgi:DNA-binding NarL/FixJ family response regulator